MSTSRRAPLRSPIRPAWYGDPPQAEAARRRLLEATARCIARGGLTATTVAAVAAEAGVSRQTVYRYFEGRDQLTARALKAAAAALRDDILRALSVLRDPADMIVEAIVIGVTAVREDPVLRTISGPGHLDGTMIGRITRRPGIEWTRETLAPAVATAGWSHDEATVRIEVTLRMVLSLILAPAPERTPEELRAFLYRHLIPGLGLDEA